MHMPMDTTHCIVTAQGSLCRQYTRTLSYQRFLQGWPASNLPCAPLRLQVHSSLVLKKRVSRPVPRLRFDVLFCVLNATNLCWWSLCDLLTCCRRAADVSRWRYVFCDFSTATSSYRKQIHHLRAVRGMQVINNVRGGLPYAKISLKKQREANEQHDKRGPGHH
jgi:hypothetical protein